MKARLQLHPYRLPLRRPWHSARRTFSERHGWLVAVSADGLTGYGDCAPLPEAGTESHTAAAQRLSLWQARSGRVDAASLLAALARQVPTPTPAADAAVETALLDLAARHARLPLRRLLVGQLGSGSRVTAPVGSTVADRLAVNAMLGPAAALTEAAIAAALDGGCRIIKLKVGTADWSLERAQIEQAMALLPPGIALRLDANGAWQDRQARAAVKDLARLDGGRIESLEEPCREPDDALLGALQQRAPFALALDESLARRGALDPARLPVRRLVLKPAVLGGLRPTLDLAARAAAAGREVVLTSLVESAAGLWATAQLAAVTGSPLAHGLATADWLAADLGEPPLPKDGHIQLPDAPGSGFSPQEHGE